MSYNEVHNVFLVLDLYSNHCTCLSDVESQGFSMFFKLRGHQPDSSALFGGQAIAKSKHVKLLRNERDIWINYIYILVGGFNPSEKKSQLGWLFPMYGKIKNVWNHQPVVYIYI